MPMTAAGCEGIGISGSSASSERKGKISRRHMIYYLVSRSRRAEGARA